MSIKPVLILAFNRPTHVKGLIDSLRPHNPERILVSVDGPRKNFPKDKEKIAEVLIEIQKINWTTNVEIRIRKENLGLRFAVADAVSWAINKHGEIIVVEDDVVVGPEFLTFMSDMLEKYRDDESIGHISGYNLVPASLLNNPSTRIRLSKIPESYAWATWAREWNYYDENLDWARKQRVSTLRRLLKSLSQAIIWKLNFYDARTNNINTWAYRWVSTLWARDKFCISPNRNLVSYTGNAEGTHTRTKVRHAELPVESLAKLKIDSRLELDEMADQWIQKVVFHATFLGIFLRLSHSIALSIIKLVRNSN